MKKRYYFAIWIISFIVILTFGYLTQDRTATIHNKSPHIAALGFGCVLAVFISPLILAIAMLIVSSVTEQRKKKELPRKDTIRTVLNKASVTYNGMIDGVRKPEMNPQKFKFIYVITSLVMSGLLFTVLIMMRHIDTDDISEILAGIFGSLFFSGFINFYLFYLLFLSFFGGFHKKQNGWFDFDKSLSIALRLNKKLFLKNCLASKSFWIGISMMLIPFFYIGLISMGVIQDKNPYDSNSDYQVTTKSSLGILTSRTVSGEELNEEAGERTLFFLFGIFCLGLYMIYKVSRNIREPLLKSLHDSDSGKRKL